MNIGILLLGLAYVLSQFFRAFLAVLTPALGRDIGATPDDLAFASGLWFLAFAALQIPIGAALDSIGPRRTAAALLLIGGGGGSAVFALATTPIHISIAMTLIGVGCAPVLMASYYIFARLYPPAKFAVLASVMVGVASLGNLIASYPMALATQTIGWRAAMWGLCGLSALIALGIWALVNDPPKVEGESKGSLAELFRIRSLWPIFPLMGVNYAVSGAIRGLWIGPYLEDIFVLNTSQIGQATFLMGIAMIGGTFAYGAADRMAASRKWLIAGGTGLMLAALCTIIFIPGQLWLTITMMCAIGFFGAAYPVIMAHGRSFLPPHLIGRGVTMLNLFSIGGVGVIQFISGRLYKSTLETSGAVAAYDAVFILSAICLSIGLALYLFSRDKAH